MKRVTWINLILGLWLIVSPFALAHAANTLATTNEIIFGVMLVLCSAWILTAMAGQIGANTLQVLCSIWVILSPFVLRYQHLSRSIANDVIVGVIALVVGLVEAWALGEAPIEA